jgi:nucleotide-binding universal stress UspA family protein
MFGRLVLGIDATAQSRDALALARLLAQKSGASVVVSHVVPHPPPFDASTREYIKLVQSHLRSVLDPAMAALSGLKPESHPIESASPARGLYEIAVEEGASLIVIGSTHRGAVGRVVLGSTGEVLVAGSPAAIAVAPKGYAESAPEAVGVVGVGYNGSPDGAVALRAAATFAAHAGARLRAIAVEEGFVHARHSVKQERYRDSALPEALDRALEEAGVPDAERVLLKGGAVECLCEAGSDTDLLVIGSRSYGPMHHALVGSVSARLMRVCPVPVLVMPRGVAGPDATGAGLALGASTGS